MAFAELLFKDYFKPLDLTFGLTAMRSQLRFHVRIVRQTFDLTVHK